MFCLRHVASLARQASRLRRHRSSRAMMPEIWVERTPDRRDRDADTISERSRCMNLRHRLHILDNNIHIFNVNSIVFNVFEESIHTCRDLSKCLGHPFWSSSTSSNTNFLSHFFHPCNLEANDYCELSVVPVQMRIFRAPLIIAHVLQSSYTYLLMFPVTWLLRSSFFLKHYTTVLHAHQPSSSLLHSQHSTVRPEIYFHHTSRTIQVPAASSSPALQRRAPPPPTAQCLPAP
jgi:hypothetical protein